MLRVNRRFGLVDRVWVAAHDAQWHTAEEIAKRIQSPTGWVAMVVRFLEQYGFARLSSVPEMRFRLDPGAPSPRAAARRLRILLSDACRS